jgi:hypothetical protein
LDDIEDSFSHLNLSNQSDFIADSDSFIYPDEEIDETDIKFVNFDPISLLVTGQDFIFTKFAQFYTRFLLELREYHLLPQKVVSSISSNICILFDMILKLIKTKSLSSSVPVIDFETAFAHVNSVINSISKSEYQFLKQCKKHFDYQPPIELLLNTNED